MQEEMIQSTTPRNHLRALSLSGWLLLFLFFCIAACRDSQRPVTATVKKDSASGLIADVAQDLAGNFSDQTVLKFDSSKLESFFFKYPSLLSFKEDIWSFYKKRNFSFAWYDANGQIEQAGNLYTRLQNIQAEGIGSPLPYITNLDSLMAGEPATDKALKTETELLLSGLYFYFSQTVWGGLSQNKTTGLQWYLPRKKLSYQTLLDSLLNTRSGLSGTDEPVYRQYNLLKPFLKKYQEIEKAHTWKAITETKNAYRIGDSSATILQIRKRLWLTGDFGADTATYLFDAALQTAVKSFQRRYGMKEDGIIGQAMLRQLNTPLQKSLQTIMVNMERSRWLPQHVEGDYLVVNIPEFTLHAYKGDSLLWDMNVVVGKSVSKTVIFSGQLSNVVFSPYWNIPASIVKSEVLPGIKRNKNYLASHHMERYAGGFRQTPGPWNSLGQVKFLFPNSYAIYLHDTPSKSLFGEDKRAFSHGCIRVAEPKKLAAYLLRNNSAWNDQKITAAMKSGTEKYVSLPDKIPVFITYFTAWVDRQGNLNFRDDIYNRDARLVDMVMNK